MIRIFFIVTVFTTVIFGQRSIELHSFYDNDKLNELTQMNSESYKPATEFISTDSLQSVWNNDFCPKFKKFIKRKSLTNGEKVKIWIELECAANGTIENIIYKVRNIGAKIDEEEFKVALKEFISEYKLPLELDGKYLQCGGIVIEKEKRRVLI